MGLEVRRIFALAEGSFHIRNIKKATLGTSSKMSQNRTLDKKRWEKGQKHKMMTTMQNVLKGSLSAANIVDIDTSLWTVTVIYWFNGHGFTNIPYTDYLESLTSSYRTCRHLWGLVMLAPLSGCQVGNADVFSHDVGEILPLYWANLTTAVTVGSMVSGAEKIYIIMRYELLYITLQQTFTKIIVLILYSHSYTS